MINQPDDSELAEGLDFYLNEAGNMVLTEKYLLKRETCCGNGCRHCPYEYAHVQEPLRTELLLAREQLPRG